ncbi:MAG TPA: helix-turn-helix domain-containing GNAT family N-acetyltransferase [Trebonia sp.]|jgi:DNA-binding MarR family transcriptional regulator/GNAT superfamily N-acetyltransferase
MSAPATAAPGTTGPTQAQVTQVRAFNRFYTNVIGVLHDMYLDTPHTLTESRLLYEIAKHGTVEVSWLRQALDIDAGYLSRVLSRFESEGLVTRHRSAADARRQEIRATDAGRGAVTELDERAAVQMGALLGGVDCGRLLDAMAVITEVLGPPGQRAVTLRPLAAGDLGWVLQRHGTVYAAEFGWDATFEDFCARIIGEFPALRDSAPGRAEGWVAEVNGVPAGSVFCVPDAATPSAGAPGGATARLRLLLVEPWARGLGLGRQLVAHCLDFARQAGYTDIVLLTYDQLFAARRIYQAAGFTLDSEHPEESFGQRMMCQTWSRSL